MRKIRFISFICVLALTVSVCSMFTLAEQPETRASTRDFITAYASTMRSGPGTTYSSVTTVPVKKCVTGDNSSWYFTKASWSSGTYGSSFGYIWNDLIIPYQDCYKVNTSAGLYLRSEPSSSAPKALNSALPNGTLLYVMSSSNGWYRVRPYGVVNDDGILGWVNASYVIKFS